MKQLVLDYEQREEVEEFKGRRLSHYNIAMPLKNLPQLWKLELGMGRSKYVTLDDNI